MRKEVDELAQTAAFTLEHEAEGSPYPQILRERLLKPTHDTAPGHGRTTAVNALRSTLA
jgi:hypothetical protein